MPRKKNSNYYRNKAQNRWNNVKNTVECETDDNQEKDSNYSDNITEMETLQTNQLGSPKLSVRVKNLPSASSVAQEMKSNFEYVLVDTRLLSSLLSKVKCQDCGGTNLVIIVSDEKQGFVHKLCTVCEDCKDEGLQHVKSEVYTSKRVSNSSSSRPPFDLNMRIVMAFSQLGKGYAGIEKFAMIMNMTTFQRKTFDTNTKTLHTACNKILDKIYEECRGYVKIANEIIQDDSESDDLVNIGVSYDGSWLTRGHKSKYGVGCVVDMVTGYVIDSHVMSKYCPVCTMSIAELGEESPEFAIWMEGHADECQANHEGSSGSMEIAAATSIWMRSEKFGFRYTTMLSDGDSKTFNHLTSLNVYGTTIQLKKEECFNHASKRAYTGIKNAITLWKARKVTLGGRRYGSLKETTVQKLTGYYKTALYRNKGDIQGMKNAILATIEHASSTDDDPKHSKCPSGSSSWCFYQAAIARNKPPGSHAENIGTPLNSLCYEKILPVYERLTDENLLLRCTLGLTQNSNESLHSTIWNKCPKETFVSKVRVDIAVAEAICEFNVGVVRTVVEIQGELGLELGHRTVEICKKRDSERYKQSVTQATEKCKRARKIISLAQTRREQTLIESEGPTYGAGMF